jgi:hypothetical protein
MPPSTPATARPAAGQMTSPARFGTSTQRSTEPKCSGIRAPAGSTTAARPAATIMASANIPVTTRVATTLPRLARGTVRRRSAAPRLRPAGEVRGLRHELRVRLAAPEAAGLGGGLVAVVPELLGEVRGIVVGAGVGVRVAHPCTMPTARSREQVLLPLWQVAHSRAANSSGPRRDETPQTIAITSL